MKPHDEHNFLVEITPEIMDELNRLYMHSDEEPIVELHYSPYWGKLAAPTSSPNGEIKDGDAK